MDTGLQFTLEMLSGFMVIGLMYFLWIGVDIRDARKKWTTALPKQIYLSPIINT